MTRSSHEVQKTKHTKEVKGFALTPRYGQNENRGPKRYLRVFVPDFGGIQNPFCATMYLLTESEPRVLARVFSSMAIFFTTTALISDSV
mmetsp:Transcript_122/g.148  ORF Transcript_122/g.148 Transcript_122/m.148 type:complete len:89 (-) Transcript_122:58-324(-)